MERAAPSHEAETIVMDNRSSDWSAVQGESAGQARAIAAGSVIAGRYEIQKLLGEGGMGAVYKARDRELDRLVALKVIRPELASKPQILSRFKQELILARQVTHKNVIRIFDLGSADSLKFITMEYVEGSDLASLMETRRFTVEESVRIVRQVCHALEAAHAENVIHRDLKPQNIMLDGNGKACVMDFGLARSAASHGMTQTGAMLGTPAYMSPEQAKGTELDCRSDLFAVGIILYELLTGQLPFQADTILGSLLKRTQETARAPIEMDSAVPEALSAIVMKCLTLDPANRYQSAADILRDLDVWERGGEVAAAPTPAAAAKPKPTSAAWKWASLSGVAALAVVAVVFGAKAYLNRSHAPASPMTVIIADFNNHTGEEVFNGTLESTLKLALEGATFITAYDRTKVRELGLPAVAALDGAKAQQIAASQGLNVVVSGSLDRNGNSYQLSARAVQTVTGKILASADVTAPNRDQVLFAVTKLGAALRKALGDSTSDSEQRLSMETLTAASLEAVHEYAAGLDMLSAGKFPEAQEHLSRAVEMDPNFGMAYTIMASAARNQGRFQEAEQDIREAIKHIDRMTERERYRTRGYLFLLTGDYQRCVDEYGSLLQKYPSDTGAYTNIAVCLVHLHSATRSLEYARRAVSILPKRAIYHGNLAMDLAFVGDFDQAYSEASEALKLGYTNGYLLQAFASLGRGQPQQAADAYRELAKTVPSDAQTGLADLAIYEGRYADAAAALEKGAADDLGGLKPDRDAAATKLWMLAYVQRLRGQAPAALAAARRALELSSAAQTRFVAGQVFADLGETARAHELAAGLAKEIQIEPQAYSKLIEGEIALKAGDGQQAVKLFTDANTLLDTWIGRFDLGVAFLAAQRFTEADAEFDRCIKRRGEVVTLFLDLPTYGFFPPVYYYQGRAREGMKTAGFADSYKQYLAIRGAGDDPLLAEVRRRAGQ